MDVLAGVLTGLCCAGVFLGLRRWRATVAVQGHPRWAFLLFVLGVSSAALGLLAMSKVSVPAIWSAMAVFLVVEVMFWRRALS